MLRIVPLYGAVLAMVFMALSLRVIRMRQSERVTIGAGGNALLERRVRVHANFAEYVPFALLLLAMAELRGAPAFGLNVLGVALVAARLAHAVGVSRTPENFRFRVAGMVGTFAAITGAAILILTT